MSDKSCDSGRPCILTGRAELLAPAAFILFTERRVGLFHRVHAVRSNTYVVLTSVLVAQTTVTADERGAVAVNVQLAH